MIEPYPPQKPPVVLLYGLDQASQDFEIAATRAMIGAAEQSLRELGWRLAPALVTDDLVEVLKPFPPKEWLVFNLCEGSPHQAFYYANTARVLAAMGYTFTGADHLALDHTQYKWKMKSLLQQRGVPTPRWGIFESAGELGDPDRAFDVFPSIVKPANEHCSYGITRDSVALNLEQAQRQAARIIEQFNGPALIEEFLDSAEFNVSVWGASQADASVLGISTMTYDAFDDIRDRLCTFEAKWDPSSVPYQRIPAVCPAPVPPELQAEIEQASVAAFIAAGCRDYGRIDLRLKDGRPMVLDVNANCDVSPDGGFANAARAAGLTYGQMLEQVLWFAWQRAASPEFEPASIDAAARNGLPQRGLVGEWVTA